MPSGAKSSYLIFCEKHRRQVTRENPDARPTEILKMLAELWTGLSSSEKKMYESLAEADKVRYQVEWAKFEQEFPEEAKTLKDKKKKTKKAKDEDKKEDK